MQSARRSKNIDSTSGKDVRKTNWTFKNWDDSTLRLWVFEGKFEELRVE